MTKSLHSICRGTFNPGKGGFVPGDIRPEWNDDNFDTIKMIQLVNDKIVDRMPNHVQLGIEMHYDTEVNEKNATEVAEALIDAGLYLAMITPGAHSHFAYGGISSLDHNERKAARELDTNQLLVHLTNREMARAEDMMREAVVNAQLTFNEMYKG